MINKKRLIIPIILIVLVGFVAWLILHYKQELENKTGNLPKSEQELNSTLAPTTPTLKTYRNEEWGFEFQYPKNWRLEENSFYSPFSKFNLQGDSSAENYNPFSPAFIINIVTPDFADRAVINFRNLGGSSSTIVVANTQGTKYEYEFEKIPRLAIDIPFGEYRMLLGATKDHEDVFNQILTTFKFLNK